MGPLEPMAVFRHRLGPALPAGEVARHRVGGGAKTADRVRRERSRRIRGHCAPRRGQSQRSRCEQVMLRLMRSPSSIAGRLRERECGLGHRTAPRESRIGSENELSRTRSPHLHRWGDHDGPEPTRLAHGSERLPSTWLGPLVASRWTSCPPMATVSPSAAASRRTQNGRSRWNGSQVASAMKGLGSPAKPTQRSSRARVHAT